MRVLLTYGSRGDIEPIVELAVQLGHSVRRCAPSHFAELPPRGAELVAAQFDTVAEAAEACDAPVATGVMPTGGWR